MSDFIIDPNNEGCALFVAPRLRHGAPKPSLEEAQRVGLEAKKEWEKTQPKTLAPYPPIYFRIVGNQLEFSFSNGGEDWREASVNVDAEYLWMKSSIERREALAEAQKDPHPKTQV